MEKVWNVSMDVSLENFKYNYNQIKSFVGDNVDIMPIFKDNAYGSFVNYNIDLINKLGIKIIGVAIIDEGIKLRQLGYKGDILILNQPFADETYFASKYDLTISVASISLLNKLISSGEQYKIHIEIETGMGRTGLKLEELDEFLSIASQNKNIEITGIFTHFSSSDSSEEYTLKQIDTFTKAIETAKSKVNFKYIHCCNSAGIINFPKAHFNLVRPGLILLGYYPDESLKTKIRLKPVLTLRSKISFLKEVPTNTYISYNRDFCTKHISKIATVPIGYADGIRRSLSNTGNVVINGKIAPIVGKVCMDCFMVDVTGIDANVGDDVYIWDNEKITVEDIAKIYDTINYEVISSLSNRIPRNFDQK